MKFKLSVVILALLMAGCSTFSSTEPTPLPTIVLNSNNTPSQELPKEDFSGVAASGIIVPSQTMIISSPMSAKIQSIEVVLGDRVQNGQLLIKLAGEERQAAILEATNFELLSAELALKTLYNNAESSASAAFLRLANARETLEDAEKHRSWKEFRNGSQSAIDAAKADLILATKALEEAEDAYSGFEDQDENNVHRAAALSMLSGARKAYDYAQANLNYLLAMPNEIDVNKADAELLSAQSELDSAQKDYDLLKNGPDPDAVALAEARIDNAQAQITANQAALEDFALKAPFDATISQVNVVNGEWMLPGQPMMVLADLDNLEVETKDLSERDVPEVHEGQKVLVFISALDASTEGTVQSISPLADILGGDVIYKTIITLDELPEGLRAGMSVDVSFSAP
ncbi:MAG: HlyD family efflux transporter periplasmic adaptor subunit [Anaerolineaceae bacterium]|nr:HlyD family efflux transporter periplasmic adaptor subunit [Anaerolineaceae bacterium]